MDEESKPPEVKDENKSRQGILKAGVVIVVMLVLAAIIFALPRDKPVARKNYDETDPKTDRCLYKRPDVLIHTKALSKLPEDMRKMPLIADFMTAPIWEDIEQSEARLSLKGTLYRLAFEKDLKIEDAFVKFFMDTPAEIALWGGYKGGIKDAMLVFASDPGKDILVKLISTAASDTQLSLVDVYTDKGEKKQAVAIEYAKNRKLIMSMADGLIYAFTNSDCALPTVRSGVAERKDWLGYPKSAAVFLSQMPVIEDTHIHEVAIDASYFSGGYSAVLEGLDTLRFTSDGGEWQADLVVDADAEKTLATNQSLWQIIPQDIALCVQWPMSLKPLGEVIDLNQILAKEKAASFKSELEKISHTEVAACWREGMPYAVPVFVAKRPEILDDGILKSLFNANVGSSEGTSKNKLPALPISEEKSGAFTVLMREVSAEQGLHPAVESVHKASMSYDSYFKVTLAHSNEWLIFSPEKENVEKVLAVVSHLSPALAEKAGSAGSKSRLVFFPAAFKNLLVRSMEIEIVDGLRAPVWARFIPALESWSSRAGWSYSLETKNLGVKGNYVRQKIQSAEIR